MLLRLIVACGALAILCQAQDSLPSEPWFDQNYHLTGPPPATEFVPADPVFAQMQEIQQTTLNILRKANFAGDYPAALAAAGQAMANAQAIAAMAPRMLPPPPRPPRPASGDQLKPEPKPLLTAAK